MGANVNGPSVIRCPNWLSGALGRYHLYFAHHLGSYIRLAYSDHIEGPWRIHAPGVLDISDAPMFYEHLASPDVHVHEDTREIRMYLHGVSDPNPWTEPEQATCLAVSADGLRFDVSRPFLGASYFRVWRCEGWCYAFSVGGALWRSRDGATPFEQGRRPSGLPARTRHLAVLQRGRRLWVAWTVIGDAPERIYLGWIDLSRDWSDWSIEGSQELLRPETAWEGAELPIEPSRPGVCVDPMNALRDPCFFCEDGVDYLLYAAAGENAIGIAKLSGLEI
ncbi:MAG: hypothetical protein AAFQ73_11810 [Pseudomonadota bacterium]